MQIDVACCRLLRTNRLNVVFRFSWWRECEELPLISYYESMLNFGRSTGHQEVESPEPVVGRIVVGKEEDDEEKRLLLYTNGISVDIHYAFLDYEPLCEYDDVVEGNVMQLTRS